MSDDFREDPHAGDLAGVMAYLRGELDDAQYATFADRVKSDPRALADLEILEAAAQIAQDEATARGADAAFEQFLSARASRAEPAEKADVQSTLPGGPPGLASWPPRPVQSGTPSLWTRISQWMREHATVLQPTFAALLIVQAGVIVHLSSTNESTSVIRGEKTSCNNVWITFNDGVSESALRNWLTFYGAVIVDGPDISGRYLISVSSPDARTALLGSEDAAKLVRSTSAPQGCVATQP